MALNGPNGPVRATRSGQPAAQGKRGRGGGGRDAQCVEDVADVARDGFVAQDERAGDLSIGLAIGEQSQHFGLARAETAPESIRQYWHL